MIIKENLPYESALFSCVIAYTFCYIPYDVSEYCFTSLSVQSWQHCDGRKPEAGTMPYSYFGWLQGFFIVHSTISSTVHSRPLNSLEHCISTTTMTNTPPTGIRSWYLQVTSPGRYEWAIGAGHHRMWLGIFCTRIWHCLALLLEY